MSESTLWKQLEPDIKRTVLIIIGEGERRSKFERIAAKLTAGMDKPLQKIKAVHDWIILNTAYDYDNYLNGTIPDDSYSAEGVFKHRTAVCSGYAKATCALLNLAGVECIYVSNNCHAWNMVVLEDKWYHLDVTHDDSTPDRPGRINYDFFLLSTETITKTKSHENIPSKYPCANQDWFDTANDIGGMPVVRDLKSFGGAISSCLAPGGPQQIYAWKIKVEDAIDVLQRDPRKVKYTYSVRKEIGIIRLNMVKQKTIDRDYFRLWAVIPDNPCFTVREQDLSTCKLNRQSMKVFKALEDGNFTPLYKYFPIDNSSMAEFYKKDGYWMVKGKDIDTRNYLLLDDVRINSMGLMLKTGSKITLFSQAENRRLYEAALFIDEA